MAIFDFSKLVKTDALKQYRSKGLKGQAIVAPNQTAYTKTHADMQGGGGQPDGGGGSLTAGGGGTFNQQTYNPVYDDLSEGSIVERWVPRQGAALNKLFRLIYIRDPICGPAVDLISTLPFSEFSLLGIKDKKILRLYEDSISDLNVERLLPELAVDFLVVGRVCASLIFNEDKGYFTNMVVHDPDFLRITPIPIAGFDPKIDGRVSPGQQMFLNSEDPRDENARALIPKQFLDNLRSGGYIPLDPLTTLYIPRKAGINDFIGTSLYTRVITLWALEKSIINANVAAVRRRAGSILHVTAGIDGQWEPTAEEIDAVANSFMKAEEDPVGAIVVTRQGIETTETREGNLTWRMSDEWSYLSEAKMRALGISDAFLSREATYSTMEQAMSVFSESLREFRKFMSNALFYNKIFRYIAKANGFIKQTQANLEHNVKTSDKTKKDEPEQITPKRLSVKETKEISNKDLIMPTINWAKQLRPEIDVSYLDVLEKLEEKGVPVSLKNWSHFGGLDIDDLMEDFDVDAKIRKDIKDKKKLFGLSGDDEDAFGSVAKASPKKVTAANYRKVLDTLPLFKSSVLGLHEAKALVKELLHKKYSEGETLQYVEKFVDANQRKFEECNYLLKRLGLLNGEACISKKYLKTLARTLDKDATYDAEKEAEIDFVHDLLKKTTQKTPDSKNRKPLIPSTSKNIFKGI